MSDRSFCSTEDVHQLFVEFHHPSKLKFENILKKFDALGLLNTDCFNDEWTQNTPADDVEVPNYDDDFSDDSESDDDSTEKPPSPVSSDNHESDSEIQSDVMAHLEKLQSHLCFCHFNSVKKRREPDLLRLFQDLKMCSRLNVPEGSIETEVEWKAYILVNIGFLAQSLGDYSLFLKSLENALVMMHEKTGRQSVTRKIMGYCLQNLGNALKKTDRLEDSVKCYQAALTAYQAANDWDMYEVEKNTREDLYEDVASKIHKLRRRAEVVKDAVIGPEGGTLYSGNCEVAIPEGAINDTDSFHVDVYSKPVDLPSDLLPISPTIICDPPKEFNKPIEFSVPVWITTDSDTATAQTMRKRRAEWEAIDSVPLKILRKSIHFTDENMAEFVIALERSDLKETRCKMQPDLWFTDNGNFIFILFIKDKSVETEWKEDLRDRGYKPTQVVLNPIEVSINDTMSIALDWRADDEESDANSPKIIEIDENVLVKEQKHYESFVFSNIPHKNVSFVLEIKSSHDQWASIRAEWCQDFTRYERQSSEVSESDENLNDVFQDKIIRMIIRPDQWRRFARSGKGLGLEQYMVENCEQNFKDNYEEVKMQMLYLWSSKCVGNDDEKKLKIQELAENFLKNM